MIISIIQKIENNLSSFNNNSLLIRYILAFSVFYSHTFAVYGLNQSTLLWGAHSLGWYAINGFFLLSGVLVAQSFLNKNRFRYMIIKDKNNV